MESFSFSLISTIQGPFGLAFAGVWGALWGSFYNVLIIRLPAEESIVRPASFCRSCKEPIRWFDNIPILSFVLLRGRCRRCGARFSFRYLLIELIVSGLSVVMFEVYVNQPGAEILQLGQFFITSLFCGLLVAIAVIDIDTMLIFNTITYPGIPTCMLLSLFMQLPRLYDGVIGGVAGYLSIRLLSDGYRLLRGKQGLGYGDAKLIAMIGSLLGWQVLPPLVLLSSLQASVIGIAILVVIRRRSRSSGQADDDEESLGQAKMPFGPFISLGAIELLALRQKIMLFFPYLQ